jgi:hypothetical protein
MYPQKILINIIDHCTKIQDFSRWTPEFPQIRKIAEITSYNSYILLHP